MKLSNRHKKTLSTLFNCKTKQVDWNDAVSLCQAMDIEVEQRDGSCVMLRAESAKLCLHSPHPQKEMKPYAIRQLRSFISTVETARSKPAQKRAFG